METDLPLYDKELASCARNDDSWLFHELLVDLLRSAYIYWFAASGKYCPHPKHLRRWINRLGLDPELARLEREIWQTSNLQKRLQALQTFIDRLLESSE